MKLNSNILVNFSFEGKRVRISGGKDNKRKRKKKRRKKQRKNPICFLVPRKRVTLPNQMVSFNGQKYFALFPDQFLFAAFKKNSFFRYLLIVSCLPKT